MTVSASSFCRYAGVTPVAASSIRRAGRLADALHVRQRVTGDPLLELAGRHRPHRFQRAEERLHPEAALQGTVEAVDDAFERFDGGHGGGV